MSAEVNAEAARRGAARLVLGLVVLGGLVAGLSPPLAQPLDYHEFADRRVWLGVANGADVLSNLGFLIAGIAGLRACLRRRLVARPQYLVCFAGITLTAAGSAYYHLHPDNARLVWDRLPMTLGFMGLLAAIVGERLGPRLGRRLLAPLLVIGPGSVLYWAASEAGGAGDLRPYVAVQFLSLLVIAALLAVAPRRYGHPRLLWAGLACYAAAKLGETLDHEIFALTGARISGHTLKHVMAAVGVGLIVHMLGRRDDEA